MIRVGLTGGIGSGKSAASLFFEQLSIPVIDADIVARQVVALGQPALSIIAQHFGPCVLTPSGELDRRWLRLHIFDHPEERQWLEALLHPRIRQTIIAWLEQHEQQQQAPYALLTSPLLLETDQHLLVDKVVVVDVPEAIQLFRTCQRDDMTEEAAQKIIDAQIKRQDRLASADFILDNSGDLSELEQQVIKLDAHLKTLVAKGL